MVTPDWHQFGTAKELADYMGMVEINLGWTETATDTMLVVEVPTTLPTPEYRMSVWNRPGVRAEMAALLGLPVKTCKGPWPRRPEKD